MNEKQYLERLTELTTLLSAASDLRPYDVELYNTLVNDIRELQDTHCHRRFLHRIHLIVFWFTLLLCCVFIIYVVISKIPFAP